jgi:diguanylate cyclase (GGDEF)-like protein
MDFLSAKKIPYYGLAAVMFIVIVTASLIDIFGKQDREGVTSMYDSWYLEEQGVSSPKLTLTKSEPVQTFAVKKGEHYILTAKVPEGDASEPCLSMISAFSAMTLYCGDQLIYSYGQDYLERGEIVPKSVLFIPIPAGMAGETLRLELDTSFDSTYSFYEFYYGDVGDVTTFFLQCRRLPIIVGIYLMLFGVLLFITLPVMAGRMHHDPSVFFHGFMMMGVGLYFLLYNSLAQFFQPENLMAECKAEYLCLYLVPLFLHGTMVFGDRRQRNLLDYGLLLADILLPLSGLVLDLTGVCYIAKILRYAHALIFLQGVYCVYYLVITARRMYREKTMYFDDSAFSALVILVGLSLFAVFTFVDLACWYVLPPEVKAHIVVKGPFLMMGAVLISVCLTLSYFFHRLAEVNEQENRENLEDLAFTDALTGLYNRTYCEQIMAKLTHQNEPGCIISLDLDRLKEVNDTKGHQVGDLFIRSFADALRDAFRGTGVVGRMGGDEFLVIMDGDHAPHVRSYIIAFERALAFKNEATALFTLSASWGIANTQDDGDGDYHATYMIADERMYLMKQKHHERSGRSVAK